MSIVQNLKSFAPGVLSVVFASPATELKAAVFPQEGPPAAEVYEPTPSAGKAWTELQQVRFRQVGEYWVAESPSAQQRREKHSKANPEFDPARTANGTAMTPEQLNNAKKAFEQALDARPDLIALARRVLLVADAARGNPMALTVPTVVDTKAGLNEAEKGKLFSTLLANPFLAELWNAHGTGVVEIRGTTPTIAEEPLVLPQWAGSIPSNAWMRWQSAKLTAETVYRLNERRELARQNGHIGWTDSDADEYSRTHDDLLARTERMVRGVASVPFAARALAALTTLASLGDSPATWAEGPSPATALHLATTRLAAALALERLDPAGKAAICREVLLRAQIGIRLVLAGLDEPPASTPELADRTRYLQTEWLEDTTSLVQVVTGQLLAGTLDRAMMDKIDRLSISPEQRPDRMDGFTPEQRRSLWMTRADERSGCNLTVTECEPDAASRAMAIYGLSTLSPAQHPELFAEWAGIERSGALNVPLLLHALRHLDDFAREGNVEPLPAEFIARLEEKVLGAEKFFMNLTSGGLMNLVQRQQDLVEEMVAEILATLGEGDGELRLGNWAIDPARVTIKIDETKPDSPSRIDQLITRLSTTGDPLNQKLQELEACTVALRTILDEFPEGSVVYKDLRRRILEPSREREYTSVQEAHLGRLLQEMREYPAYAVDTLVNFRNRVRQDLLELQELIGAPGMTGATVSALTYARERIRRLPQVTADHAAGK